MLNANDAAKFINTWVNRNGYNDVFRASASTILTENRRESRPKSNARKYGKIPYYRNGNGTVSYLLEDLQTFCNDRLKSIYENKLREKLAKAAGLKYYIPYSSEPETRDLGEWLDEMSETLA